MVEEHVSRHPCTHEDQGPEPLGTWLPRTFLKLNSGKCTIQYSEMEIFNIYTDVLYKAFTCTYPQ